MTDFGNYANLTTYTAGRLILENGMNWKLDQWR